MRYDPERPMEPETWLGIDEHERLYAVQCWVASRAGVDPEDCISEAAPVLALENQIATGKPPVTRRAMERLTAGGVYRTVAVAVMAGILQESMERIFEEDPDHDPDAYERKFAQLDPEVLKANYSMDQEASNSPWAVPEFDAGDRQTLIDFGDTYAEEGGMGYPETAGFLFAVVACPYLVMPSDWYEIVQGNAVFDRVEEARAVMQARMALMNWISGRIRRHEPAIPDDCLPAPDPMVVVETENDFSRWCRGVAQGHEWLEEMWDDIIVDGSDEDQALGVALTVLGLFNNRELAERLVAETGLEARSVEEAARMLHPLIEDAILDYAGIGFHNRRSSLTEPPAQAAGPREPVRSSKIGRNQPCPCGSGKKYKKCCGRPGTRHH